MRHPPVYLACLVKCPKRGGRPVELIGPLDLLDALRMAREKGPGHTVVRASDGAVLSRVTRLRHRGESDEDVSERVHVETGETEGE